MTLIVKRTYMQSLTLLTRTCNAHTLHANGEPLLKQSLVCKWRRDGSTPTFEASSNLLNDDTDAFVRVIVSSIRKNRARYALYKKLFDLLDEESVSGACSGRVLFEKVSRLLKYD